MPKQNGRCMDCGEKFGKKIGPAEIDHIHPHSLNGKDCIENYELRCRSCNAKKHTKLPADHAKNRGELCLNFGVELR